MLCSLNDLRGYSIHATDGDIGYIDQFYFDDVQWVIRYLVVDTGTWLTRRRVLISPIAIERIDEDARKFHTTLTRDQVEHSPDIKTHEPVTRRHEVEYHAYYEWPLYWMGAALWGAAAYPSTLSTASAPEEDDTTMGDAEESPTDADDSHLQSTHDVTGYHIEATDGAFGHVEDFIVDDETWAIRYLVVDTRNWWPGKRVLLAPAWIRKVEWERVKVYVDVSREAIRSSPEYDPSTPITPDYEVALFTHYGRSHDSL
jgi:hypothetical protein